MIATRNITISRFGKFDDVMETVSELIDEKRDQKRKLKQL